MVELVVPGTAWFTPRQSPAPIKLDFSVVNGDTPLSESFSLIDLSSSSKPSAKEPARDEQDVKTEWVMD